MITQAQQQHKLLQEDISRAEKAGLVTNTRYHVNYYCGDFMVPDAVTRDVLIELLNYLWQAYPDIRSTLMDRSIYYGL